MEKKTDIKAIIGLGNPGPKFTHNRHNIGFLVLDALAEKHGGTWHTKDNLAYAELRAPEGVVVLVKPQTFMNSSGKVIPFLQKKGIKPENILVVHDELELPFGQHKLRLGGSAKGHNGLRSIIDMIGKDFWRLSCGVGRPENREDVGNYVLSDFTEGGALLASYISNACNIIDREAGLG
ncbi:MAG: aminoacyl-tRNA hydrolase [Candidatus Babeliales bacterium]